MTTREDPTMWVVELTVPEKTGFTLWGQPGADDTDRVLTSDRQVLLFLSVAALRLYAGSDQSSDYASSAGYRTWSAGDASGDPASFDLVEVGATLALPAELWDMSRCALVVDGLNMMSDLAASLDRPRILDRWSTGHHGSLLDGLTFVTEEELPAAVADLNPRRALDGYLADLADITARTRFVS